MLLETPTEVWVNPRNLHLLRICLPICLLARITQLVRGFSSTWKQSVEALSQDVMRSFTNFKNGTSIIQVQPYETNLVNICVAI